MLNFFRKGCWQRGGGGYIAALLADSLREIWFDGGRLVVEIARTIPELTKGLSSRKSMDVDSGMLLVFPKGIKPCLWMRDTSIALDAAFIGPDGAIVSIAESMQPNTDTIHCATGRAIAAVEVNAGWFAEKGIVAGDMLKGWP